MRAGILSPITATENHHCQTESFHYSRSFPVQAAPRQFGSRSAGSPRQFPGEFNAESPHLCLRWLESQGTAGVPPLLPGHAPARRISDGAALPLQRPIKCTWDSARTASYCAWVPGQPEGGQPQATSSYQIQGIPPVFRRYRPSGVTHEARPDPATRDATVIAAPRDQDLSEQTGSGEGTSSVQACSLGGPGFTVGPQLKCWHQIRR